jgi:mevalonate kinase
MKQFTQNKFLVLLVAILLIANLGLMLYFFVYRKDHDQEIKSPRVSDFVQKELGFSADQAVKFQQLRDQHKEAVKPIMDEMKKLKDSLYNLLQKPGFDDSTAVTLANDIGEKQKVLELMIFHHFQKVRAICDSSQLPKFDTLVHRMINRGPWMRKKRPSQK